jgi:BCCT, betaine/carnitine/choline family transporter
VFYLAWWITWAAFVGIFIASISKGRIQGIPLCPLPAHLSYTDRTLLLISFFCSSLLIGRKLWEVAVYTLFAPTGYCIAWFCTLGGAGLRQSRQALELEEIGARFFNDTGHFASLNNAFCYDVPQEQIFAGSQLVFTNYLPGVTPVCLFDEDNVYSAPYNLLNSFRFPDTFSGSGLGSALSLLFIVASALYGVTSCDSASLIADNLASTGRRNNHWARRMFWSITVGALGTAVLSGGGENAVRAVQAASILCGLPFAFVLCFMMQSIVLLCRAAENVDRGQAYLFPSQPTFVMPVYGGVFNAFEYVASFGRVNPARVDLGMDKPSRRHVVEFCKGVAVPFVSLHQILTFTYPENRMRNAAVVACYTLCYLGFIAFLGVSTSYPEFRGLGWTLLAASGGILSMIRAEFRAKHNLRSHGIADAMASVLIWPQVLTQMRVQLECAPSQSRVDATHLAVKADVS